MNPPDLPDWFNLLIRDEMSPLSADRKSSGPPLIWDFPDKRSEFPINELNITRSSYIYTYSATGLAKHEASQT